MVTLVVTNLYDEFSVASRIPRASNNRCSIGVSFGELLKVLLRLQRECRRVGLINVALHGSAEHALEAKKGSHHRSGKAPDPKGTCHSPRLSPNTAARVTRRLQATGDVPQETYC